MKQALAILREIRGSLQFANDSPGGGGIDDTLWMKDTHGTIFDALDELGELLAAGRDSELVAARGRLDLPVNQARFVADSSDERRAGAAAPRVGLVSFEGKKFVLFGSRYASFESLCSRGCLSEDDVDVLHYVLAFLRRVAEEADASEGDGPLWLES